MVIFLDISFVHYLEQIGISTRISQILNAFILVLAILIIVGFSNFIAKLIINSIISKIIKKTTTKFDDILLEKQVLRRLSHLVPAIIVYFLIGYAIPSLPSIIEITHSICILYMIFAIMLVINSFIDAIYEIYISLPVSKSITIKGYLQIIKIGVWLFTIIFALAIILGKSPVYIFTGFGAMAAILLLVFKDTLLGFVATIQLSALDLLKPGDWIIMPARNADGRVMDISISTIKIQNWNKTITSIPTYAMVSESFQNCKGIYEAGMRRIKRSVLIDIKTIKFCTVEMLEKFENIKFFDEVINEKKKELKDFEKKAHKISRINENMVTNLWLFIKYLYLYLSHHPSVIIGSELVVRQLQHTDKGLPVEIYFFTHELEWGRYEVIQTEIYDHIISIVPEFELGIFN